MALPVFYACYSIEFADSYIFKLNIQSADQHLHRIPAHGKQAIRVTISFNMLTLSKLGLILGGLQRVSLFNHLKAFLEISSSKVALTYCF